MEYLAIRNGENSNVYYFNTKGEKGRILSKFPKISNRVFLEEDKELAMEWANVTRIATEEENLWATTKQKVVVEQPIETKPVVSNDIPISTTPVIENAASIEVPEYIPAPVTPIKEDGTPLKHIMSDFEKIIEIYKKNGMKIIQLTMVDQSKYYLITDDIYYIDNFGQNDCKTPMVSMNEHKLKEFILEKVEKAKESGNKGAIFNNFISFDMFAKIPRTKYLAFGDLVYTNNLNMLKEKIINENKIVYEFVDNASLKNISFHVGSILKMEPVSLEDFSYIIREKEFTTYIKRYLKQQEKQQEKSKAN